MVFRVWLVKNAIWIVSSFKDSQWRYENVCDLKSSVIVAPLKYKIYYLQQIHTCNFVAKNPSLPHKNKCITFGSFTFLAAFGVCLVVYICKLPNWKMHSGTLKSPSSVRWWWFLYTWDPSPCCPHSMMLTWTVVCPFPEVPSVPHLGAKCTPTIGLFDFCIPRAMESGFIHLTRRFNKESCVYSTRWVVMWLMAKLQNTNWENTTLWYVWPSTLSFTYHCGFLSVVFCLWKPRK